MRQIFGGGVVGFGLRGDLMRNIWVWWKIYQQQYQVAPWQRVLMFLAHMRYEGLKKRP
jgi:hypothetical protein